ncbi:MAG: hypothetical protein ACKPKO_28820, partial [Candidatus Fonsibacter sp.]
SSTPSSRSVQFENLLFNNVFVIDKKQAKSEKKSKQVSIFRLSTVKDVEQDENQQLQFYTCE